MMNRPLASHLHCAIHGRDLITLDLRSGDYELLAGVGTVLTLSEDHRHMALNDPALLSALEAMNLFGAAATTPFRQIPALPTRSALFGSAPEIAAVDWARMARGWSDMALTYHRRSFASLLKQARRPDLGVALNRAQIIKAAAIFDTLSVWLPFQGDCLYRCFFLLRLLGAAGRDVAWVFGVRTWPFYAHCWLQIDDLCLTDAADRLVSFTPILAA